jgi:glucose/arabinose dehydrogenase/mono/diheme cytochrome c family protein
MRLLPLLALLAAVAGSARPAGESLYRAHCQACHLPSGQGVPGVFPPLAASDFLADRARTIRALCEGLSGPITVNGVAYNGVMPLLPLSDAEIAEVLTFVYSSWGNSGEPVTAIEVARVRATLKLPTLDAALAAAAHPPLPPAPEGFTLRELARLPELPARLALHPDGAPLVLTPRGNLWRVDPRDGAVSLFLDRAAYLDPARPEVSTTGFCFDDRRRLYLTVNEIDRQTRPVTNRVRIVRSAPLGEAPPRPETWLETAYPYGVGPFNHAVNHIAQGPDGWLYVNSGSRTDANESGSDERYFQGGEVPSTACLWRLDPHAERPEIEIVARGLRNAYGFAWDGDGRLVATENGPDADAPEELNVIGPGRHYGFPFRFADWDRKPYPHTPDAPPGLRFTDPVRNDGPDGGAGLATFEPHSCPSGIAWLDDSFPPGWRGSFLIARFGNLLRKERDTGFDVLRVRLRPDGAGWRAETTRVLGPLGRPLDVATGPGVAYLLEYSRHTELAARTPQLPGRLLELRVAR